MKIIGRIEPEFEQSEKGDRVVNGGYINGLVMAFTPAEVRVLKLLQNAVEGDIYQWFDNESLRPPKEGGMDKALWLVYQFVKARFAVNELSQTVKALDDTLMRLEEGLRSEAGHESG